jgi:hypothetical protein
MLKGLLIFGKPYYPPDFVPMQHSLDKEEQGDMERHDSGVAKAAAINKLMQKLKIESSDTPAAPAMQRSRNFHREFIFDHNTHVNLNTSPDLSVNNFRSRTGLSLPAAPLHARTANYGNRRRSEQGGIHNMVDINKILLGQDVRTTVSLASITQEIC